MSSPYRMSSSRLVKNMDRIWIVYLQKQIFTVFLFILFMCIQIINRLVIIQDAYSSKTLKK